jgi:YqxM protein
MKEGSEIRVKRLRKFRNRNWLYVFSLKLGLIFYSMTFSIFYLTGNTLAYFNDSASVNGIIQIGTWQEQWDKSSLTFLPNNKQSANKGQCTPINATIKNGGDGDMQGPVNYEIWWTEKGNPKDGIKVGGGEVKALKSGESLILSYSATKDGNFKFKAYQRTGHPGQGELWSEEILVNCFNAKSIEEPKDNPEKTEEGKTPEQEQPQPEKEEQTQQSQQSEPITPEATQEKTEQVPTTQTSEIKDTKPADSTNTDTNTQGSSKENTSEPAKTTPISQSVEQNETQKDDPK